MKKCDEFNHLMTEYTLDPAELSKEELLSLEEHTNSCRSCREEFLLVQRINNEAHLLDDELDRVMASIDWEETAYDISEKIPFKENKAPERKSLWPGLRFFLNDIAFSFNWKLAGPALAGVLLVGIWVGYFFFHTAPTAPKELNNLSANNMTAGDPVDRLENTLARKEVAGYFTQTQLMLTDLMKQCNSDGTFSFQSQVDIQRVRTLLGKSRYFNQNLNDPQFMSSKPLLKKIEWLLFEILMSESDEKTSCQKLHELQEYIKQERLLFKIRLVGKDISTSEV